jgi:hypothetical protein
VAHTQLFAAAGGFASVPEKGTPVFR